MNPSHYIPRRHRCIHHCCRHHLPCRCFHHHKALLGVSRHNRLRHHILRLHIHFRWCIRCRRLYEGIDPPHNCPKYSQFGRCNPWVPTKYIRRLNKPPFQDMGRLRHTPFRRRAAKWHIHRWRCHNRWFHRGCRMRRRPWGLWDRGYNENRRKSVCRYTNRRRQTPNNRRRPDSRIREYQGYIGRRCSYRQVYRRYHRNNRCRLEPVPTHIGR